MRFQVGHIAELKWALNTMLLENLGTIGGADARRDFTPAIFGGTGGGGGRGGQTGGNGGYGGAPQIQSEDTHRFREIWGGTGGTGGVGGRNYGHSGTSEQARFPKRAATRVAAVNDASLLALSGGTGTSGRWGTYAGGEGGEGEAAHIALEQVRAFQTITGELIESILCRRCNLPLYVYTGGYGGPGGGSERQGGHGGGGQGSKFPKLLLSIDEDTRRRVPYTILENFAIGAELRQRLQNHGFRTVGGLLEAYDSDVEPPYFKAGHASVLTAALRKFITRM
ncbi:hypothetical protein B0H11DRAFT_2077970 [Mycena galericulata]|nr:hypothetical protein B0H11DRAFT_2077970 [Mycena galericulata]